MNAQHLDKNGTLVELNPSESVSPSEEADHEIHDDDWLNDFIDKMANGREVEHITLEKTADTSLGFSVVGLESDNRGELGIFVQDIQPDTIADMDGRLKESDQILVINGKPLGLNVSHTEAIAALQAVKDVVQLVVARGPIPRQMTGHISRSSSAASSFALKPSERRWAHRETIQLRNEGKGFGFGIVGGKATGVMIKTILGDGPAERDGRLKSGDSILKINGTDLTGMGSEQAANLLKESGNVVELEIARGELPQFDHHMSPSSEEIYEVELTKDESGIGIHIAGYVDSTDGGIHVKAITPESPAARDGRIQEGDQIIAVNGLKLDGPNVGSEEAVMALQNTGHTVHLTLSRRNEARTPTVTTEEMDRLKEFWEKTIGEEFEIIICQVQKEHVSEPLGFDVEGAYDENGRAIHTIRKIAAGGRVAKAGKIRPGDRLLEANGKALLHMDQEETIDCLKNLPQEILFVVAREKEEGEPVSQLQTQTLVSVAPSSTIQSPSHIEIVAEETEDSEDDSDSGNDDAAGDIIRQPAIDHDAKKETVSLTPSYINHELEHIQTNINIDKDDSSSESSDDEATKALKATLDWIVLDKGPNGLGFSILDSQDDSGHYVKIRGLVAGGAAEQQGDLKPEDKLIFVNGFHFDMTRFQLQDCVAMLKSLPPGKLFSLNSVKY